MIHEKFSSDSNILLTDPSFFVYYPGPQTKFHQQDSEKKNFSPLTYMSTCMSATLASFYKITK